MRKCFFLLLFLLLLAGCAAQQPEAESTPQPIIPDSILLTPILSEEVPEAYALSGGQVGSILPLGDGLLLFVEDGSGSQLELVSGSGAPEEMICLDFPLSAAECVRHSEGRSISFFDPNRKQTLVLDDTLSLTEQIDAPKGSLGAPVLSGDQSTLYYCTADAIRALELSSGIHRIIKEADFTDSMFAPLLLEDTVLPVCLPEETLFLSTETGGLLDRQDGHPQIFSSGMDYCSNLSGRLIFGTDTETPQLLLPRNGELNCFFLPELSAAVTVSCRERNEVCLQLYDLSAGTRTASVTIPQILAVESACSGRSGSIWLLTAGSNGQVLYRWMSENNRVADDVVYTAPYHSREESDPAGLEQCRISVEEIETRFGIEICIDPESGSQDGYVVEPEYLVPVIQQALAAVDTQLARLPDGFLTTLTKPFAPLKITLVRKISPEGNADDLSNILLWEGRSPHILLAVGQDIAAGLCRQICYLAETTVLIRSTAYDQWSLLNPTGFTYYPSFGTDPRMDGEEWLQEGQESFLNTASMRSPQEDRAQLFIYAMTPGMEHRFRSPYLQAKLRQLCLGLREGFGLEDDQGSLPWEQHLT